MEKLLEELDRKYSGNWELYFKNIVDSLRFILLLYSDFDLVLDKILNHPKSKLAAASIKITCKGSELSIYTFGKSNEKPATITERQYLDNQNYFECEFNIWIKENELKARSQIEMILKNQL